MGVIRRQMAARRIEAMLAMLAVAFFIAIAQPGVACAEQTGDSGSDLSLEAGMLQEQLAQDELTAEARDGAPVVQKDWDLAEGAQVPDAANQGVPSVGAQGKALTPMAVSDAVELAGGTMSVQGNSDQSFRFVLRWGAKPLDLDSHIAGYRPDGKSIHVYYSSSSASYGGGTYCTLDHDDVDSYGPETIDLASTSNYPCYYYIHNFSGSPKMTTSGAHVDIYKGGKLVKSISIPLTGSGRYWNVGVVKNGQLSIKNTITSKPDVSYSSIDNQPATVTPSPTPSPAPVPLTTITRKRVYPDYAHKAGMLNHYMVNADYVAKAYPDFAHFTGTRYVVPGLEYSTAAGGCDAQVPQGMCVTNEYIIISAYCAGDKLHGMAKSTPTTAANSQYVAKDLKVHSKSGKVHDSALYVLKRDGTYVATVTLNGIASIKNGSHVGGITFDDDNLWIASSTHRDGSGNLQEFKIPYSRLTTALQGGSNVSMTVSESDLVSLVGTGNKLNSASFNTYDGMSGLLWVGNNKTDENTPSCNVVGYRINGSTVAAEQWYRVPAGGNGATFMHKDGRTYLALNISPGRADDSRMLIWDVTNKKNAVLSELAAKVYVLPPMLEESYVKDGNIYTVYESGASVYACFDKSGSEALKSGRAKTSVDEICVGSVFDVLNGRPTGLIGNMIAQLKLDRSRISVACPVNVTLLDSFGEVAGRIVDGEVDEESLASGIGAWVDGDVKNFIVPNDEGYSVLIEATDSGTMDVQVTQYGNEGQVTSTVSYDDIALAAGGTHEASLMEYDEENADTAASRFELQGVEGAVSATSSVDDASTLSVAELTILTDGQGTATSSQTVTVGDSVTLTAHPDEGMVFDGWYEVAADGADGAEGADGQGDGGDGGASEGDLRSGEPVFTLDVDRAMTLVARFSPEPAAPGSVTVEGNGSVVAELDADGDDGEDDEYYDEEDSEYYDEEYDEYYDEDEGDEGEDSYYDRRTVFYDDGSNYDFDQVVTLRALEVETSLFDGWYVDGECLSTDETCQFDPWEEKRLVAKFRDTDPATVEVHAEGRGYADLTRNDAKVGGKAVAEAANRNGGEFEGWFVGDEKVSDELEYEFAIEGDTKLTAKFASVSPTMGSVRVSALGSGKAWVNNNPVDYDDELLNSEDAESSINVEDGTWTTSMTAPEEDLAVLYAHPTKEDVSLLGWYCDGEFVGATQLSPVEVRDGVSVVAWFSDADVTLTTKLTGASASNKTEIEQSDRMVDPGSGCWVDISLDDKTTFLGWYEDGKLVSQDQYYEFWTTRSRVLEARVKDQHAAAKPAPAAVPAGHLAVIGGSTYRVANSVAGTVIYQKAPKKAKSAIVPATVRINGRVFAVTGIAKGAFKGTKVKKVTVKTARLTKASVKGCFKSAKKLKTVKVPKAKKKAYKKIFAKKNSGKKVKVK